MHNFEGQTVRERLQELMTEHGYTQERLAAESNIPKGTISNIISGRTKSPGFSTLEPLVLTLGSNMVEFLYPLDKHNSDLVDAVSLSYGMIHMYERTIKDQQKQLEESKQREERKSRTVFILSIALACIVIFLIAVLVYDLTFLDRGWIQTMFNHRASFSSFFRSSL